MVFKKKFIMAIDIDGNYHKKYYGFIEYYKIVLKNLIRKESYPSKEFSIKNNIQNIHTDWVITFNHKWYFLFWIFKINTKYIVDYHYNILIKENPSLKNIDCGEYKHDVIYGAVSKFNKDDIENFVLIHKKEIDDFSLSYMKLIYDKYNMYPEWVLSHKTFNHIINYEK